MTAFYDYNERPLELEKPFLNLAYLIKILYESMVSQIEASMREFELTAAQWYPLVVIDLGQADTPAEIARWIGTDTGAMTRMIDRLESKGFVKRTRSEQDGRVIKLKLTDKGNQVTKKLMPAIAVVLNHALTGLSQEEFEQFKHLTLRILMNLNPEKLKQIQDHPTLSLREAESLSST